MGCIGADEVFGRLIMLSILGCFVRGLWYFIFSIVVMGHNPIETHSRFCQATGFFITLGNEMTGMSRQHFQAH
jgi:G protein-coupled receptor GPR1